VVPPRRRGFLGRLRGYARYVTGASTLAGLGFIGGAFSADELLTSFILLAFATLVLLAGILVYPDIWPFRRSAMHACVVFVGVVGSGAYCLFRPVPDIQYRTVTDVGTPAPPSLTVSGISVIGSPDALHPQTAFAIRGSSHGSGPGEPCGNLNLDGVAIVNITGAAVQLPSCATLNMDRSLISGSREGIIQLDPHQ